MLVQVVANNLVHLLANKTHMSREELERESHDLKCRGKTPSVQPPNKCPQLESPPPSSETKLLVQIIMQGKQKLTVYRSDGGAFRAVESAVGYEVWENGMTCDIAMAMAMGLAKVSFLNHLHADTALTTRSAILSERVPWKKPKRPGVWKDCV